MGGSVFFHADSRLFSTADGSLVLSSTRQGSGSDSLGSFSSLTFSWRPSLPSSLRWETIIREYPLSPSSYALLFTQHWVSGASNTSTGDRSSVLSSFPSFLPSPPSPYLSLPPLGFIQWAGSFAYTNTQLGQWSNTTTRPRLTGGLPGGPLLLFDRSGTWTAMVAPWREFMATSVADTGAEVHWGVVGSMQAVPAGWSMDTILYVDGAGVNAAIEHWGDAMLRVYGKDRGVMEAELTTSHLGYATDNGAFYYYDTESGESYETTLLDVQRYWESLDLPFHYVWWDSWWYPAQPTHNRTARLLLRYSLRIACWIRSLQVLQVP